MMCATCECCVPPLIHPPMMVPFTHPPRHPPTHDGAVVSLQRSRDDKAEVGEHVSLGGGLACGEAEEVEQGMRLGVTAERESS